MLNPLTPFVIQTNVSTLRLLTLASGEAEPLSSLWWYRWHSGTWTPQWLQSMSNLMKRSFMRENQPNNQTTEQHHQSGLSSVQLSMSQRRGAQSYVGNTQEPSGNKLMIPCWKVFFLECTYGYTGWKVIKGEGKMTTRDSQRCGGSQTLNSHFSWHFSLLTLVFVH